MINKKIISQKRYKIKMRKQRKDKKMNQMVKKKMKR